MPERRSDLLTQTGQLLTHQIFVSLSNQTLVSLGQQCAQLNLPPQTPLQPGGHVITFWPPRHKLSVSKKASAFLIQGLPRFLLLCFFLPQMHPSHKHKSESHQPERVGRRGWIPKDTA